MITSTLFLATVLAVNVETGEAYEGMAETQSEEQCILEVEAEMRSLERDLEARGIRFEMEGTCRRIR